MSLIGSSHVCLVRHSYVLIVVVQCIVERVRSFSADWGVFDIVVGYRRDFAAPTLMSIVQGKQVQAQIYVR